MDKKKAKRIILDEYDEAKNILSSPTGEIVYKKIFLLGKYFYEEGFKPKQVKQNIIEYCSKSEVFNLIFFEKMIDTVVKKSKFYRLRRSNYKIAITKKEIDKLKKLPHKYYKISLYMLFVSKLEKYQSIKKEKKEETRSFKTYFNYDLESAMYNSGMETSKKEIIKIGRLLYDYEIAKPVLSVYSWEMICCDFDSKDVEFAIEAEFDFDGQIKYYCLDCGNVCAKSRKHDLCLKCYSLKRKERNKS